MNAELAGCTVAPAKVRSYLLDPTHPDGCSKAQFFMRFGFDPARPDELRVALVGHAATQPIIDRWSDEWGEHWNVRGPLRSPDGRNPTVTSGWVKDGPDPPRLATAVP